MEKMIKYFLLAIFCLFIISCASAPNVTEEDDDSTIVDELEEITTLPDELPETDKNLSTDRIADEIQADEESHIKLPIIYNDYVEDWINYFTIRGRSIFTAWLERSSRYLPMMKKVMRENSLPEDLAYLAMIESGFKVTAYSRARAVGQWQFISSTGKKYGLNINWWLDERRDPVKSTIAAAKYLKDLHAIFDSWYLAAAAYNAGEGKMLRAIEKYNSRNFWELTRKHYLKKETKHYVPKLLAAIMIAKNPEKYGFNNVEYQPAYNYKLVTLKKPMPLQQIARICGEPYEVIKEYNSDLRRWITPPHEDEYTIKLPDNIPPERVDALVSAAEGRENDFKFKIHRVARGETLAKIAQSYETDIEPILKMNNLKSFRSLRLGQELVIPVPPNTVQRLERVSQKRRYDWSEKKYSYDDRTRFYYTVKGKDNLTKISHIHNVKIAEIRMWNGLPKIYKLMPGERLVLYVKTKTISSLPEEQHNSNTAVESKAKSSTEAKAKDKLQSPSRIVHKIQKGDTLWKIARLYGVRPTKLKRWNNIKNSHSLIPGESLTIYKD